MVVVIHKVHCMTPLNMLMGELIKQTKFILIEIHICVFYANLVIVSCKCLLICTNANGQRVVLSVGCFLAIALELTFILGENV